MAIIAAFHITGAKYGRKKLRWLLRMPSAHAESTSTAAMGKTIRATATVSSRRSPSSPGMNRLTMNGASSTPRRPSRPATPRRSAKMAPATRPASSCRFCWSSSE